MTTYDLDSKFLVSTSQNWTNCNACIFNKETEETILVNCNEVDHHGYSDLMITISSSMYNNFEFRLRLLREDTIQHMDINIDVVDHIPTICLCIHHANYTEILCMDENMKQNGICLGQMLYDFANVISARDIIEDHYCHNLLN